MNSVSLPSDYASPIPTQLSEQDRLPGRSQNLPAAPVTPIPNDGELRKPHVTTPPSTGNPMDAGAATAARTTDQALRFAADRGEHAGGGGLEEAWGGVPVGDGYESGVDEVPAG